MNPLMWPTSPATQTVPPFNEMPVLDEASPSMMIRPPRLDAPADSDAFPDRTVPLIRFSRD